MEFSPSPCHSSVDCVKQHFFSQTKRCSHLAALPEHAIERHGVQKIHGVIMKPPHTPPVRALTSSPPGMSWMLTCLTLLLVKQQDASYAIWCETSTDESLFFVNNSFGNCEEWIWILKFTLIVLQRPRECFKCSAVYCRWFEYQFWNVLSFKTVERKSFGLFKGNSSSKSPVTINTCFISTLDKNFHRNLRFAGITSTEIYWKGKKKYKSNGGWVTIRI